MGIGQILLACVLTVFGILAVLTICAIIFEGLMMAVELAIFGIMTLWNKFKK